MKKLIFLAAVLAVLFVSCKDTKPSDKVEEIATDSTTVKIDSISKLESPSSETQSITVDEVLQ